MNDYEFLNDSINKIIESYSKELRMLKDEFRELSKEVSSLKEIVLKDIARLETKVNSICEQLGQTMTKNGAQAMKEKIYSIEKDYEQSFETLKERLDSLNKTLSEKIDSLKSDVDKLEKKVDDLSETSAMSKVYFSIILIVMSALFSFLFSYLIPGR